MTGILNPSSSSLGGSPYCLSSSVCVPFYSLVICGLLKVSYQSISKTLLMELLGVQDGETVCVRVCVCVVCVRYVEKITVMCLRTPVSINFCSCTCTGAKPLVETHARKELLQCTVCGAYS